MNICYFEVSVNSFIIQKFDFLQNLATFYVFFITFFSILYILYNTKPAPAGRAISRKWRSALRVVVVHEHHGERYTQHNNTPDNDLLPVVVVALDILGILFVEFLERWSLG